MSGNARGSAPPGFERVTPGAVPMADPERAKRRTGEVDESTLGREARAEAYRELIGDRQADRDWLAEHPNCEEDRCGERSTDVLHRDGKRAALCRPHYNARKRPLRSRFL